MSDTKTPAIETKARKKGYKNGRCRFCAFPCIACASHHAVIVESVGELITGNPPPGTIVHLKGQTYHLAHANRATESLRLMRITWPPADYDVAEQVASMKTILEASWNSERTLRAVPLTGPYTMVEEYCKPLSYSLEAEAKLTEELTGQGFLVTCHKVPLDKDGVRGGGDAKADVRLWFEKTYTDVLMVQSPVPAQSAEAKADEEEVEKEGKEVPEDSGDDQNGHAERTVC